MNSKPKYIVRVFVDGKFAHQIGAFPTVFGAINKKREIEACSPRNTLVRVYEMREVQV